MSYRIAPVESVCPSCHHTVTPGSKISSEGNHLECPAPVPATFVPHARPQVDATISPQPAEKARDPEKRKPGRPRKDDASAPSYKTPPM